MSDEITAARRKKRRRYNLKRFSVFTVALVVVVVAAMVVNAVTKTTFLDIGDWFTVVFKGGGGYPAELGDNVPLQVERISMSYAVVTEKQLLTYSSSGARLLDVTHGYLNPCIDANENRILLYNAGSRDISLYNRSRLISEFKTEYGIINAKVANDGTVAVLTKSDLYTCQMEIYRNGTYDRLMTWKGYNGFPFAVYIKDDGSAAAAIRVVARGEGLCSIITSVDFNKKAEQFEVEVNDLVIGAFYDGGNLVVITDRAAYVYNKEGHVGTSYKFPDVPVLSLAVDDSQNISVAFGDNHQNAVNRIIILAKSLKEKCVIEECGAVKGMYMDAGKLWVLGERIVGEYDLNGKLKQQFATGANTVAIFDLNGLIAVMPDRVERLKAT